MFALMENIDGRVLNVSSTLEDEAVSHLALLY